MQCNAVRYAACSVWVSIACVAALAQNQALPLAVQRPVSFADDVHPILAERCFKCHNEDKRRGGLFMSGREALLEGGETGPSVIAGNSEESLLIRLVSGLVEDVEMPPKEEPLTADQISILRAWIDQGLEWDYEFVESKSSKVIHPPRRPDIPDVAGVDHPIDKFLAAYLQQHEVEPGPLVDDSTYARRVYLDLTGLLPTQAELDAFLNDQEPEKRARLVHQLLSDRRAYAEHWMTFWNDALRNDFEGTGYIDGGRKQITPWLYSALYENMPYDRFVTALVNPTPENEGFLNGIIWRGVTAANMQVPLQAAQSVSQVFLGVNLKCASCHDSFVDDWKLRDSYGMAAVFSKDALELVRCDLPTGEQAEGKFLWPELGEVDMSRSREGRLTQIARLITMEENGRFARTIVNRLWAKLMGRGLVEPLDVMSNEPWHRDLLDWLAMDLVDHGYDLKHTLAMIATSNAYQMPSVRGGVEEDYVFRGPEPRRMSAEQLLDGIGRITGAWQENPKFGVPGEDLNAPENTVRAWRIPANALTRALGRPNREQVTTWRVNEATTLQSLELTNGEDLWVYLRRGSEKLAAELGGLDPAQAADTIYLRALQRPPTGPEREAAAALMGGKVNADGFADLLWAVAMLPEFQLIY